uniref:Uncharacterized protein n=1 Tax=Anopheles farauti TaxID=69004 RepID=A0A182Q7Z3_9DIPT
MSLRQLPNHRRSPSERSRKGCCGHWFAGPPLRALIAVVALGGVACALGGAALGATGLAGSPTSHLTAALLMIDCYGRAIRREMVWSREQEDSEAVGKKLTNPYPVSWYGMHFWACLLGLDTFLFVTVLWTVCWSFELDGGA